MEERLLKRSLGLVRWLIKRRYPSFMGQFYQEMVSAGLLAAWDATRKWDGTRSSWLSFVSSKVRWAIQDTLRLELGREGSLKQERLQKTRSLAKDTIPDPHSREPGWSLEQEDTLAKVREIAGSGWPILQSIVEGTPEKNLVKVFGYTHHTSVTVRKQVLFGRLRNDRVKELLA